MTQGTLSDSVIVNGKISPDAHNFHTQSINAQMDNKNNTAYLTTFYTQWALANAGVYTGPINGIIGNNTDLYDAFVALYNQAYSGPNYAAPANGHVSYMFFRTVFADYSSVDTAIYKVVD